jgi:hypothetical protein
MSNKGVTVILDAWVVHRCIRHGHLKVFELTHGLSPVTTEKTTYGIEHDPLVQAQAKMAECALCDYLRCSIELLHWGAGPDNGTDLTYLGRHGVKSTGSMTGRYLFWPYNRNDELAEAPIDFLWLVRVEAPSCHLAGWVTKAHFLRSHHTAGDGHKLKTGTCYLDDELGELNEPGEIFDA